MTTPDTCRAEAGCAKPGSLPRCKLCTHSPTYWGNARTAPDPPADASPLRPTAPGGEPARTTLDWSGRNGDRAASTGDPAPCVHCGALATLRHPVTGRPCHKVCEERALDVPSQRRTAA